MVKEFELDPMSDVCILLDMHADAHVSPLILDAGSGDSTIYSRGRSPAASIAGGD